MLLTRRTFVQSSLAASLVVAAEATHSGWLLKPDAPIRIAIAGLGASAIEHISLFAAIPGVHIVALADPSNSKLRAAIDQFAQLGRPRPSLYNGLSSLLDHSAIDALSLPSDENLAAISLHEVLATRIPVLIDLPPRNFPHRDFLAIQKAQVRLRAVDRLYPGAQTNIQAQWRRRLLQPKSSPQIRTARLILERQLSASQLRAVLIAALEAVLGSHPTPATQLTAWLQDPSIIEFTRASTVLQVHLQPQISHFDRLDVDLLPRSSRASILSLGEPHRTMQVPIWRAPDSRSSLRTVLTFLGEARSPSTLPTRQGETDPMDTATDASLSFAAASIVDRALALVEPRIN